MKTSTLYILLMVLISGSALLPHTAKSDPVDAHITVTAVSDRFIVQYDKGRITIQSENIPLSKLLNSLAEQSGIQVSIVDPTIALWPVSVSFKGLPLHAGLENILNGFSYAAYRRAKFLHVIVLSTPPNPAKTENKPARTKYKKEPRVTTVQQTSPQHPSITGQDDDTKPQERQLLLENALEMLASNNKQSHAEVMDKLVGINDLRATQALVEQASSHNNTGDATLRIKAVEALWQHAADLKFSDNTSVNALRQLAADSNDKVAMHARQAVTSMEQYLQQQTH